MSSKMPPREEEHTAVEPSEESSQKKVRRGSVQRKTEQRSKGVMVTL